jgi:hypothetical protein
VEALHVHPLRDSLLRLSPCQYLSDSELQHLLMRGIQGLDFGLAGARGPRPIRAGLADGIGPAHDFDRRLVAIRSSKPVGNRLEVFDEGG